MHELQIVVLRKTVAGIGPQCRAFHYCCPFYRRTSLPPPAVQVKAADSLLPSTATN